MAENQTAAQEFFEGEPPKVETIGSEEGAKPTNEGPEGKTETQKFEEEFLGTPEYGGEAPPEETPPKEEEKPEEVERLKGEKAFFQTQHQEFHKALKKVAPQIYDKVVAEAKGETKEEPAKEPEKIDIYENPGKFLAQVTDAVTKASTTAFEKVEKRSQQNSDWKAEHNAANDAMERLTDNYRTELGFEADSADWKAVEDKALKDTYDILGLVDEQSAEQFLGRVGGPTQAAKVFELNLRTEALQKGYSKKVIQSQVDSAAKIKAAAEVAQPGKSAAGTPKKQTKQNKFLEAIEGAQGNTKAKKEVFGG